MRRYAKVELRPIVHISTALLTLAMSGLLFVTPWWSEAAVVSEIGSDEWQRTRLDQSPHDSLNGRIIVSALICGLLLIAEVIWRHGPVLVIAWLFGILGAIVAFSPPLFDPLAAAVYYWPYTAYLACCVALWLIALAWSAIAFVEFVKRQSGG